ncbi:MFS transporter [Arthrobacter sp. ISL-48]|uniref:MFS transporter n=1 Tax=Arthrobacter sp. ISL-48 TaxID=2819110 RepID=UPI001BE814D9|nr:MFS transporter [Arthrobacter sp. ISL-48]MBT2532965.1 MFS transporter [Arthrobacter sp. ISL-48]
MPDQRTRQRATGGVTQGSRTALIRYVLAATAARTADAGAPVAFVLLAISPASGMGNPGLAAGILAACLTAPHLLGPLLGRRLDLARDGRKVIAVACLLYGLAVAASAVFTVRQAPLWVVGAFLVLAGTMGPLLTGGLSSRLAAIVRSGQRSQRRAQGWDASTYGLAGAVGPAAVAALSAAASPLVSALALAGAALLASILTMTFPTAPSSVDEQEPAVPRIGQILRIIAATGPLRRTAYVSMAVAMPGAMISISALGLTSDRGDSAVLIAAFGLGSLAGSLAVVIFPLKGQAENLVIGLAAAAGAGFVASALFPASAYGVAVFGIAGVLNSLLLTATLASRTDYAPKNAAAQVFIWMAALKVAIASLGTATAGFMVSTDARLPLLAGGALAIGAALVAAAERRHGQRRQDPSGKT